MNDKLIKLLQNGKIGVAPTDTIYGIVGSVLIPDTVEKIYKLRKRESGKPMIILISDLNDLNQFSIKLADKQKKFLKKFWPNPISVVLPCDDPNYKYLHRGTNSLAFRMPKDKWLLNLLKRVGPLVAPSANIEGEKVAESIADAKKYFGDEVDFYVDGGKIESVPSTLIQLNGDDSFHILRQGSYKIPL